MTNDELYEHIKTLYADAPYMRVTKWSTYVEVDSHFEDFRTERKATYTMVGDDCIYTSPHWSAQMKASTCRVGSPALRKRANNIKRVSKEGYDKYIEQQKLHAAKVADVKLRSQPLIEEYGAAIEVNDMAKPHVVLGKYSVPVDLKTHMCTINLSGNLWTTQEAPLHLVLPFIRQLAANDLLED